MGRSSTSRTHLVTKLLGLAVIAFFGGTGKTGPGAGACARSRNAPGAAGSISSDGVGGGGVGRMGAWLR